MVLSGIQKSALGALYCVKLTFDLNSTDPGIEEHSVSLFTA